MFQVPSYHMIPQTQMTSPHLPSSAPSPHLPPPQVTSPHLCQLQATSTNIPPPHITSPLLVPQTQVTSPHLQVTSPHLQVTSPHHSPHLQVTSPHLQVTSPHLQVTSPHLQVTSPHHSPHLQVTSPHHSPHLQVTSPHLQVSSPHLQVTSPHHSPHLQVTSPHLQVTSHHLQVTSPHIQVSSPHLQVTSHHLQVTSPHLQVSSPHLLPPPQHHLYPQNHDPGADPDWSRSELSYLLRSYSDCYQNQTTALLDLQNQNQFSDDVTQHRDELENTYRPYNTLFASGVYGQVDTPGPVQDTWRPLGPTLSQLQCSPLGSTSGEVAPGRWSSSSVEDFSGSQFFHDGYYDNNNGAPQPFCSPTTPGPSPHYPQAPAVSSPGPQMHHRDERLDFHTQTSRNKTLSCCLHEVDRHPIISEPGQHHLHETSQHLLQSQTELVQDQTSLLDPAGTSESFSPQGRGPDVSSAPQPPGLAAGLSCGDEGGGRRRGRGGGRRRGGRGDNQPDWTWAKQLHPEGSAEVLDCRLLCTVCKRDFRSLPALNGHMRSHSGSRSATWLKKGDDSSSLVTMVMPVSVPIQSRGAAKACRGGQRRSSRLSPATSGAALYRSLLHQGDRDVVAKGDGEEAGVVAGGVHYTPPPMLCPVRAGPGLHCSLTTRGQQRAQTLQLHNAHNGVNNLFAVETASPPPGTPSGVNKPRINVGRSFQAELPPLQSRKHAHSNSHNALLLWAPWDELEHPVNQQRVEDLLTMAHSSVMPGGGASPDAALHVLSECRGDFLLTVKKLLSTPETSDGAAAQQHPRVSWSAAERRLLVQSLQLHHKDFSRIQRHVQTKSLSQCVEFYYLWKKKQPSLTVTLPDAHGQRSSGSPEAS